MVGVPLRPLVDALSRTVAETLGCEISLREASPPRLYEVSAIVTLSGRLSGTLVISFSEYVALRAASNMLLVESDGINDDVVDSVAELANHVVAEFNAGGHGFELHAGSPSVVMGRNHRVRFPSTVEAVAAVGDTRWGPIALQLALDSVPQLAAHI
jgi:CheY-specific phosphatase CheX